MYAKNRHRPELKIIAGTWPAFVPAAAPAPEHGPIDEADHGDTLEQCIWCGAVAAPACCPTRAKLAISEAGLR